MNGVRPPAAAAANRPRTPLALQHAVQADRGRNALEPLRPAVFDHEEPRHQPLGSRHYDPAVRLQHDGVSLTIEVADDGGDDAATAEARVQIAWRTQTTAGMSSMPDSKAQGETFQHDTRLVR
jgi:hypothetical protein